MLSTALPPSVRLSRQEQVRPVRPETGECWGVQISLRQRHSLSTELQLKPCFPIGYTFLQKVTDISHSKRAWFQNGCLNGASSLIEHGRIEDQPRFLFLCCILTHYSNKCQVLFCIKLRDRYLQQNSALGKMPSACCHWRGIKCLFTCFISHH